MKDQIIQSDVVLIGAGIMSATLGILLKELQPNISIIIVEKLEAIAKESSDAWNNAGTGHSAFCELNYTPQKEDGHIDISKAINIATSFEYSKEFWAYLVDQKKIILPANFIHRIPHLSFVWGNENVEYLEARFKALTAQPLFKSMQFSTDHKKLSAWMPLVMEGRSTRPHEENSKMAATFMEIGTDVNFGALTRAMFDYIKSKPGVQILLQHEVRDIEKSGNRIWSVETEDEITEDEITIETNFVFIGAGGGTLPLLEKSNIEEAEGYGGFPISGQWLICNNEEVIERHTAKVYGKASVGSPPMSVPHLDTRIIEGKRALLFGPFAGFSTKFLKHGSYWDLPASIEFDNIFPMLAAGWNNMPLTKYLIHQVTLSHEDRIEMLREYLPLANADDWELAVAGQRVQVIKKDKEDGGVLEFGTEVVSCADGSLAGLLGASPGASTSLSIMIDVLKKCFALQMESPQWSDELKKMIPSYGQSFLDNENLVEESRSRTHRILGL
jgi:malate dehydrogenase (quinone)